MWQFNDSSIRVRCNELGLAFELSVKRGYDSKAFVEGFMHCETAYYYGLPWDYTQAQSGPYFVESVELETEIKSVEDPKTISPDVMYWMGWQYCYCNMRLDLPYAQLYELQDFDAMVANYPRWHSMDPEVAMQEMCLEDHALAR